MLLKPLHVLDTTYMHGNSIWGGGLLPTFAWTFTGRYGTALTLLRLLDNRHITYLTLHVVISMLYLREVHVCAYIILFCMTGSIQASFIIAGNSYSHLEISTRPTNDDPVAGGDTIGSNCAIMTTAVQCSVTINTSSPLIDGDLGPKGANYTSTMVHTWHRSVKNVTINYVLSVETQIYQVNLYFYRITSMNIGLPSITLSGDHTPLEHYIKGNGDLTQEDSMRRNVLLRLRSTTVPSSRFHSLQFNFESTDIDWLVLSETELCRNSPAGLSIMK